MNIFPFKYVSHDALQAYFMYGNILNRKFLQKIISGGGYIAARHMDPRETIGKCTDPADAGQLSLIYFFAESDLYRFVLRVFFCKIAPAAIVYQNAVIYYHDPFCKTAYIFHVVRREYNCRLIGLVIFLALIYLIIFSDFQTIRGSTAIKIFIAGIASGLMINFQMSLGICIFFGSFIFLFIYSLKTLRNRKQKKFLVISNTILISGMILQGIYFQLGTI